MANREPYEQIGERTSGWFGRRAQGLAESKHPVLKVGSWIAGVVAIIVIISFVSGLLSFGNSYLQAGRQILSVENVRTQRTAIIQEWQGLLTATGNACQVISQPSDQNAPTIVENPALAYAATVRNLRSEYNRRQHNLFEAQEVGPPGYPSTVPDQSKMDSPKPHWCAINRDLAAVHS